MIIGICACDKNYLIGNKNALPWHIPKDLQLFQKQTKGHIIVMGRKTYESFPQPLPHRTHWVLTSQKNLIPHPQVNYFSSFEKLLEQVTKYAYDEDIFIIGGASIYALFWEHLDEIRISHIKKTFTGNIFFPPVNWNIFREKSREKYDEFDFVVYQKIQA